MKLTLETYGKKYLYEEDRDDYSLSEMLEIIEGILLNAGYRFEGYLDFITEEEAVVISEDNSKL